MTLEQKLKALGEKNIEVCLRYKNNLNGIIALVTWHDPKVKPIHNALGYFKGRYYD